MLYYTEEKVVSDEKGNNKDAILNLESMHIGFMRGICSSREL